MYTAPLPAEKRSVRPMSPRRGMRRGSDERPRCLASPLTQNQNFKPLLIIPTLALTHGLCCTHFVQTKKSTCANSPLGSKLSRPCFRSVLHVPWWSVTPAEAPGSTSPHLPGNAVREKDGHATRRVFKRSSPAHPSNIGVPGNRKIEQRRKQRTSKRQSVLQFTDGLDSLD